MTPTKRAIGLSPKNSIAMNNIKYNYGVNDGINDGVNDGVNAGVNAGVKSTSQKPKSTTFHFSLFTFHF